MTTPILCTVRLAASNGNPADDCDNDFVFELSTFTSTDADDLATALTSFYNTVQTIPGVDYAVAGFLGDQLSRAAGAVTIDMYDLTGHLDGSDHGSPAFTRSFTLGANTDPNDLACPSEVAVALSFHADLDGVLERVGSTRPASRRRGRVFIGPLVASTAVLDMSAGQPLVAATVRDTLCAAGITLAEANSGAWRVWSRASAAVYPVVGGWVDNTFDTIRKRGPIPSGRTLWSV